MTRFHRPIPPPQEGAEEYIAAFDKRVLAVGGGVSQVWSFARVLRVSAECVVDRKLDRQRVMVRDKVTVKPAAPVGHVAQQVVLMGQHIVNSAATCFPCWPVIFECFEYVHRWGPVIQEGYREWILRFVCAATTRALRGILIEISAHQECIKPTRPLTHTPKDTVRFQATLALPIRRSRLWIYRV
jgi:hypothetical protein